MPGKQCKKKCKKLEPNGLWATNVLKYTTNSPLAEALTRKHSQQWVQLALDIQYQRLSKIQRSVVPLNEQEDQLLRKFQSSLAEKKTNKLNKLRDRHPTTQ